MRKISLGEALKLLRIDQWIKNTFIFLPLFFAGKLSEYNIFFKDVICFISFSLIASSVYIFNDLIDINSDRLHPKKKFRPLAAGKISKGEAYVLIFLLQTISFVLVIIFLNRSLIWLLFGLYLIQNVLYTIKLKQIAIVDITIIAVGFLIRIALGGVVTNTQLSHWIIIMTFLLALFLALAKRRDDALIFLRTGQKVRQNIDGYNLEFLTMAMAIMSAVIVVSYIQYVTSSDVIRRTGSSIYLSTLFVLVGILRYLQLTLVKDDSGNPTKIILTDKFLQITVVCWIAYFSIAIYLHPK